MQSATGKLPEYIKHINANCMYMTQEHQVYINNELNYNLELIATYNSKPTTNRAKSHKSQAHFQRLGPEIKSHQLSYIYETILVSIM